MSSNNISSIQSATVSPTPKQYTLYLPKKYRHTAKVSWGDLQLDVIKETMPEQYNDLLQRMKSGIDKNWVFVDIYKNNMVFFEYKKIAEIAKQQVFEKFKFPIEISEIVITDIDQPQTASIYEEIHQPCHNFENYTDYPATYTFENSI